LQPLLDAADKGLAVRLSYQSYERTAPRDYTFEPVLLTEFASRWYACGYYVEKAETRVFALDRIKDLEALTLAATGPYSQDYYRALLDPVIGVTLNADQKPVEVVLKASAKQIRYLESVPLHSTQRIAGEEVRLTIRPNVEFYQAIISLGKEIEVVSPKAVRNEVVRQLREALNLY
jgi:predicted DNA-binding transcriptional regulator YafY